MTNSLSITPEALEEMDAAFLWYETQQAGLGERFLSELNVCFDRIREHPDHWAILHRDIRASLMHHFPYVVYFKNLSDCISVTAILHGSRHPREWRRRS